jgi:hypothetical protein
MVIVGVIAGVILATLLHIGAEGRSKHRRLANERRKETRHLVENEVEQY